MSAHSQPPPPYPGDTDKSQPPPQAPYQPPQPYPAPITHVAYQQAQPYAMPVTNIPNLYQQPQACMLVTHANNQQQSLPIFNIPPGLTRRQLNQISCHYRGDAIIIMNGKTYTTIREPIRTTCPCCGAADVLTVVNYEVGRMSFQLSMMLISVVCVLGCCLIPCFRDRNKDAIHCCPNCQGKIFTAPGRFI